MNPVRMWDKQLKRYIPIDSEKWAWYLDHHDRLRLEEGTGFKDKTGSEIMEHDLVYDETRKVEGKVKFSYKFGDYIADFGNEEVLLQGLPHQGSVQIRSFTIIGNIHEGRTSNIKGADKDDN